jgi:hypothetical protein
MDKQRALERLQDERAYEDELVQRLNDYILNQLENIPDIKPNEQEKIRRSIEIIIHDSIRHSYLFSDLMQTVIEDDERQY